MEVLEAIGGITIFFLVIYLFISNEDRKKEAYKRYVDFLGLGDEKLLFNEYFSQNKHMAYEQAVRKFYSKATNFERANNLMKEHLETIKESDDLEKKKYTIKRVFAYEYEDFFYSLFSPYAKYSNLTGWSIYSDSIPKEYIINKLAEWKKVSINEIGDLFEKCVENELIHGDFKELSIKMHSQDHYSYKNYCLGLTLTRYANIISDSDMNIHKWIEKNGQRETLEELKEEISMMANDNTLTNSIWQINQTSSKISVSYAAFCKERGVPVVHRYKETNMSFLNFRDADGEETIVIPSLSKLTLVDFSKSPDEIAKAIVDHAEDLIVLYGSRESDGSPIYNLADKYT